MKKSQLLGTVCAASLVLLSNTAQSALVTELLGLDIGGTLYDVTFHTTTGDTFMALWDADNDGVFGGGASVFTAAPTFWGNEVGADAARDAIMGALGAVDTTTTRPSDSFAVPWGRYIAGQNASFALTSGLDEIVLRIDGSTITGTDNGAGGRLAEDYDPAAVGTYPYASFQASAVPVPAAAWLFGSGLLGLVGVARRKARA